MYITVRKRDNLLYQGEVEAVSSTNKIGDFDILPSHANFVSTIEKFVRIHLKGGVKREFEVNNGIIRVAADNIDVFIGI